MPHPTKGSNAATVLQLANVSYEVKTGRKQTKPILTGIDLSLYAGQSIAVMGPSGAGKSTLLALCMGLIAPSNGDRCPGRELTRCPVPSPDGRPARAPPRGRVSGR